jgi:uncharacterized YceG family protein
MVKLIYMKKKTSVTMKVVSVSLILIIFAVLSMTVLFLVWTKQIASKNITVISGSNNNLASLEEVAKPFPVGVSVTNKKISEDPLVDSYMEMQLSFNVDETRRNRFFDRFLAQVAKFDWYQNLASSVSRVLVIYSGERREEIALNFSKILNWDKDEKQLFLDYIAQAEPAMPEGKFFPGRYIVPLDASPELVADLIYKQFSVEILSRYDSDVEAQVPLADALAVASLLEREAYDFTDMRYISGIIWNRLFINMPLQLDASLQYAKGSKAGEKLWWPKVVPDDKYINSPYNTYKNTGLPPTPIANPSVEAVMAALNPRVTDCMFYFHDQKGKFSCTKTYEEHVANLKKVYGQGI